MATSAAGSPAAAAHTIKVALSDAGCSPTTLRAPSGPATFQIVNTGSTAVTEFELRQGATVVGEAEHVTPSAAGTFSLTLQPGQYSVACTGGNRYPIGTLTVTGRTAEASAADQKVLATYRAYLVAQTALLTARTERFTHAVIAGNRTEAMALFASTREPYERIEPVAEAFGDLDPRIDDRINDVAPGVMFTGFHRIEQALWKDHTTAGMAPIARQLLTDVEDLQGRVRTLALQPAQIANGAVGLLGEVSKSKITGEEDRYSHTDLWDFEANVEGSQTAFAAVRPLLEARNPAAVISIDSKFTQVLRLLEPFRQGGRFEPYAVLTRADKTALSQALDRLAEPLSNVPAQVVSPG